MFWNRLYHSSSLPNSSSWEEQLTKVWCSKSSNSNMLWEEIHLEWGFFSILWTILCQKMTVCTIFPKTIKLGKRNLIINSNYIGICREISHSSLWIEVQWLETHPVLCVIKIRALVTFYLPWQQRLQKKLIIKQKSLGCYCCGSSLRKDFGKFLARLIFQRYNQGS